MLSTADLQRVSVEKAAAVLVLADKFSLDPSKNISQEYFPSNLTLSSSSRRRLEHHESDLSEELQ